MQTLAWILAAGLSSVPWEVPSSAGGKIAWVQGSLYFAPGELDADSMLEYRRGEDWLVSDVVARHRDGSVEWLEVVGETRHRRGSLERTRDPSPLPARVQWRHRGLGDLLGEGGSGRLRLDGDRIEWSDPAGGRALFSLDRWRGSLGTGADRGEPMRADAWKATAGRVRRWGASYELRSRVSNGEGIEIDSSLRLDVLQGGASVRGELSVVSRSIETIQLDGVSLRIDLSGSKEVLLDGAPKRHGTRSSTSWEQTGPDRWSDGRSSHQGRIPEAFTLRGGHDAEEVLRVEIPRFARYWPCSLKIGPAGFDVELAPRGCVLSPGGRIGVRFRCTWRAAGAEPLEVVHAIRRGGKRVALPGFPGHLPRAGASAAGAMEGFLAASLADLRAWMEGVEGGRIDYGDLPLADTQRPVWSNLEYDPARGLAIEWMRGGPEWLLDLAEDLLFHGRFIDMSGSSDGGAMLPRRHGEAHGRDSPVDVGHVWTEGYLLVGRLLLDESLREAGIAMCETLARRHEPHWRWEGDRERSYAWPLVSLEAGASESGLSTLSDAAKHWSGELLDRFDRSSGWFLFETRRTRYRREPDRHTWLSGGLILEALDRVHDHPGVREAIGSLSEAIWEDGYDGASQTFFARLGTEWRGTKLVGRGRVQGVQEGYLLHGLLRAASRLDRRDRIRDVERILDRRGASLFSLDPDRPWNDLSLLLRASPLLLSL